MKFRSLAIVCTCLALIGLLASCSSTKLLSTWTEPSAQGKKLGKVLVVGVAQNATTRRQYEDSFVRELASKKIAAIASYQHLPDAATLSKEAADPIIASENITQVLVTRVVDTKTVTSYVPPTTTVVGGYPGYYPGYYGSWSGYYGYGYSSVTSPGYTYDTTYVNLESNIYEVASGKLIWSGLTETAIGSSVDGEISAFIAILIGAMGRSGLV